MGKKKQGKNIEKLMLLSCFCALSFLLSNNKLDFVEEKKGTFLQFGLKNILLVCPRETVKKIKVFSPKRRSPDFILAEVILQKERIHILCLFKKLFFPFFMNFLIRYILFFPRTFLKQNTKPSLQTWETSQVLPNIWFLLYRFPFDIKICDT